MSIFTQNMLSAEYNSDNWNILNCMIYWNNAATVKTRLSGWGMTSAMLLDLSLCIISLSENRTNRISSLEFSVSDEITCTAQNVKRVNKAVSK